MRERESVDVVAIGEILRDHETTLAVAESLTGGELSARFARASGSSDWYRGAMVAYASDVKRTVLDVPEGPVVSERAVRAMAEHVTELLGADVGLAVTGVAGPAPQDDQPPGTVWIATHWSAGTRARLEHFSGDAPAVVEATMDCACAWLLELLTDRR
jgi:nicotinamide-nucleotide amidase